MARRRHRGDGSVYYSATDKRWIARVSLGVVNGKRITKRVKCRTQRDANLELERLRRSYNAGSNPATGTLSEWLAEWLPTHAQSIRKSTRDSYDSHIRTHIDPLLGGIPLARLQPSDVRRLVAELNRKGLSPAMVHNVVRTLSSALNAAVAERSITDNATEGVKLPRVEREPVRPLLQVEADAIYEAVKDTWVEWPVRVLLGSGLRRGEVLGLDQGDVLDGYVRVRVSKTYVRAVPVSGDAMDALRDAIRDAPRRGPNEPVFFAPRTGDRMRGDSITHALPRLLDAVGIGHLTPHALRHGAATLMLADGVQMRVISEQLGHRNPSLTARVYAHVVPESQRSAIGSLERGERRTGPR